jgi:hypothetical protein
MAKKLLFAISALLLLVSGCTGTPIEEESMNTPESTLSPSIEDITAHSHPFSYDLALAETVGLSNGTTLNEKFAKVQNTYRLVLSRYLESRVSFSAFDETLESTGLGFTPAPTEDMSAYQQWSEINSAFIYIRNNLHVERLPQSHIDTLIEKSDQVDIAADQELQDIVQNSWVDVIKLVNSDDAGLTVGYDTSGNMQVPNSSLLLEVSNVTLFDSNGKYIDRDKDNKRIEYLEKEFAPLIESDVSQALDFTVKVHILEIYLRLS